MHETNINFFVEDTDFCIEEKAEYVKKAHQVAEKEGVNTEVLNFIFCSDS